MSAQAVRPCVTTTQPLRMIAARAGVRFFPALLVLPVGTHPWMRPVAASAQASRWATPYTIDRRSISGRHPGIISGNVIIDSIDGAIGR